MLTEDRRLLVARAEVVVEVQTTFADADDARALGQSHQFVGGQLDMVLGFMRVGADRAPDVIVRHGQGVGGLKGRQLVRNLDHQTHPGLASAGDDFVAVLVELRGV
ncbi:hypothetical protein D3C80_1378160 [compost metagenome]